MASCKDCIHCKVCCQKHLHVVTGMDFVYRYKYNHIERECKDFKDRSRFVELPCKVGDTIYEIVERKRSGKWIYKIVPRTVEQIEVWKNGIGFRCGTTIWVSDNLAFFTREEAEQALKEREENV